MNETMENEVETATVSDARDSEPIQFDSGPAKWLRLLLAIIGCGLMVATIPVFFPVTFIEHVHGLLGLGDFPAGPISIYLARSTSMLYAVHGFLMLFVSFDIKRYWPLVQVFGWLHVVMGLTMFGIDLNTPMPLYWIVGEGIQIAMAGLLILCLYSKAAGSVS